MSNKTQLQTNNTSLDALIARVNAAKDTASSLPEAGSGGSGGASVETCTIEICVSAAASLTTAPLVYYTDKNMSVACATLQQSSKKWTGSVEVVKGTILNIRTSGATSSGVCSGGATTILRAYTSATVAVGGDGAITID